MLLVASLEMVEVLSGRIRLKILGYFKVIVMKHNFDLSTQTYLQLLLCTKVDFCENASKNSLTSFSQVDHSVVTVAACLTRLISAFVHCLPEAFFPISFPLFP